MSATIRLSTASEHTGDLNIVRGLYKMSSCDGAVRNHSCSITALSWDGKSSLVSTFNTQTMIPKNNHFDAPRNFNALHIFSDDSIDALVLETHLSAANNRSWTRIRRCKHAEIVYRIHCMIEKEHANQFMAAERDCA